MYSPLTFFGFCSGIFQCKNIFAFFQYTYFFDDEKPSFVKKEGFCFLSEIKEKHKGKIPHKAGKTIKNKIFISDNYKKKFEKSKFYFLFFKIMENFIFILDFIKVIFMNFIPIMFMVIICLFPFVQSEETKQAKRSKYLFPFSK